MALINGRSYDWSMLEFNFSNIAGEPIMGIKGIKYSRDRKIENNYGVGSKPIGRGFGNITYSASITMDMNAVQQLKALSPSGELEDLGEFDLVVSYNHPESGATVIDTIKSCIFSENGADVSQDDTSVEKEFNLNPGDMEFNDKSVV